MNDMFSSHYDLHLASAMDDPVRARGIDRGYVRL
jgi:hypothetical protein